MILVLVFRCIFLTPQRRLLQVFLHNLGGIRSTSQHGWLDLFRTNEDHIWRSEHNVPARSDHIPPPSEPLDSGSIIIPIRSRGLRSDAVYRSVRHKVYRSLTFVRSWRPCLAASLFRAEWDIPRNPDYSVVKEHRGCCFCPSPCIGYFFRDPQPGIKNIF